MRLQVWVAVLRGEVNDAWHGRSGGEVGLLYDTIEHQLLKSNFIIASVSRHSESGLS